MSLADSMARPGALFSDSLFNLADKVLNFASIFLNSALGLQVGAAGKFAGLLLRGACLLSYRLCSVSLWFSPLFGDCFRFVEVGGRLLAPGLPVTRYGTL